MFCLPLKTSETENLIHSKHEDPRLLSAVKSKIWRLISFKRTLRPVFYNRKEIRKLCSHLPFSFNPLSVIGIWWFLIRYPTGTKREEMPLTRLSHAPLNRGKASVRFPFYCSKLRFTEIANNKSQRIICKTVQSFNREEEGGERKQKQTVDGMRVVKEWQEWTTGETSKNCELPRSTRSIFHNSSLSIINRIYLLSLALFFVGSSLFDLHYLFWSMQAKKVVLFLIVSMSLWGERLTTEIQNQSLFIDPLLIDNRDGTTHQTISFCHVQISSN